MVLIKTFLSSPLSMNSQRYLEIANHIPLQMYKKLLNKSKDKLKFDVDPLIDCQISGIIQLMLRNYTQADLIFQKSLEISKNNIHTPFLQSNSARLNFNFNMAENILKNLLKIEPENAIFWDRLGLISLDRHHFSRAEEYFTKSWEKNYAHNPHNHSLMQLVWIKIEFHQFEKAQELIETAKKNDLN
ncbi:MAG: hypothetical protein ACTSPA_12810, partial [Promethearchaeota archaeon]